MFFNYRVNTIKVETMIFSNAKNVLKFLPDVLIWAEEIRSFDEGIKNGHFIIPWSRSVKGYNAINLDRFMVYFTLQGVIIFNQQNIKEKHCSIILQFKREFDTTESQGV